MRNGVVDRLAPRRREGAAARRRDTRARGRRCRAWCRRSSGPRRRARRSLREASIAPAMGLPAVPDGSPASEARTETAGRPPDLPGEGDVRRVVVLAAQAVRAPPPPPPRESARGAKPKNRDAFSRTSPRPGAAGTRRSSPARRSPRERLLVERAIAADERAGRELASRRAGGCPREKRSQSACVAEQLERGVGHRRRRRRRAAGIRSRRPRRPRAGRRPRSR